MTEPCDNLSQAGQVGKAGMQNEKMSKKSTGDNAPKRTGKRGRRPSKVDVKVKLERSRQSARECRARKKLRYQYLEELVNNREKAVYSLRSELEQFRKICESIDNGQIPEGIEESLTSRATRVKTKPSKKFVRPPESDSNETPYDILVDVLGAPKESEPSGKQEGSCKEGPQRKEEDAEVSFHVASGSGEGTSTTYHLTNEASPSSASSDSVPSPPSICQAGPSATTSRSVQMRDGFQGPSTSAGSPKWVSHEANTYEGSFEAYEVPSYTSFGTVDAGPGSSLYQTTTDLDAISQVLTASSPSYQAISNSPHQVANSSPYRSTDSPSYHQSTEPLSYPTFRTSSYQYTNDPSFQTTTSSEQPVTDDLRIWGTTFGSPNNFRQHVPTAMHNSASKVTSSGTYAGPSPTSSTESSVWTGGGSVGALGVQPRIEPAVTTLGNFKPVLLNTSRRQTRSILQAKRRLSEPDNASKNLNSIMDPASSRYKDASLPRK